MATNNLNVTDGNIAGFLSPTETRISGPLLADTPDFSVYAAGEIIDPVNWAHIIEQLRSDQRLPTLAGRFAACVVDKTAKRTHLVSDFLSQYPLYYLQRPDGVTFSTSQASFVGLSTFDECWLYDQLAFNFSPMHRSFLRDVVRMPAASVCTIDGTVAVRAYSDPLKPRAPTGTIKQQLGEAIEVFSDRMPRYARDGEQSLVGLTSGFDSRTILAFSMDRPGFGAYTYGVDGCTDLDKAGETARRIGIRHRTIPFDREFEARLPELAADCVWMSGGLQGCIRATMPYVYETLSSESPVVLSGVSGDQLFRGHGNVPDIVSHVLAHAFKTGTYPGDQIDTLSKNVTEPDAFRAHVTDTLDALGDRFGPHNDPAAAMGYLAYVVPAEYFSGEAVLADRFVKFRTPFCDPEIVKLAYRTSLSSLAFSKFSFRHDNLKENYLPANLVALNPRLRHAPIKDRPLGAFSRGNRFYYLLASAIAKVRHKPDGAPLEDWNRWSAGVLRPVIERFLSGDTRIGQYVTPQLLQVALADKGPRLVLRLLSIEMLLTLIESGWRRNSLS